MNNYTTTLNTIHEALVSAFSNLMRGDRGFTLVIDTDLDDVYLGIAPDPLEPWQQAIRVAMDEDGVNGHVTVEDCEESRSYYGRFCDEAALELIEDFPAPFRNLLWGDVA